MMYNEFSIGINSLKEILKLEKSAGLNQIAIYTTTAKELDANTIQHILSIEGLSLSIIDVLELLERNPNFRKISIQKFDQLKTQEFMLKIYHNTEKIIVSYSKFIPILNELFYKAAEHDLMVAMNTLIKKKLESQKIACSDKTIAFQEANDVVEEYYKKAENNALIAQNGGNKEASNLLDQIYLKQIFDLLESVGDYHKDRMTLLIRKLSKSAFAEHQVNMIEKLSSVALPGSSYEERAIFLQLIKKNEGNVNKNIVVSSSSIKGNIP